MTIRLSRRVLLQQAILAALGSRAVSALSTPSSHREGFVGWLQSDEFAGFIRAGMRVDHVPGLSLVALDGGRIVHQAAFGLADIATGRPMTPQTLMNIASITKTITCTAVMQLWEQGKLDLDGSIDRYLPFKVRNPRFPERFMTTRQLLTHTSSIADGPAYEASYRCGDQQGSLADWLAGYLTPDGVHFDAERNFHPWAPGGPWAYSNVGFGVLGLLVERLGGLPYSEYCIRNIFAPLGMKDSRFLLVGMDRKIHATPYRYVADGNYKNAKLLDPEWSPPRQGGQGVQLPHCLYSFATLSDGLARCTAAELARFLSAYALKGAVDGSRVLKAGTVAQILSDQRVRLEQRSGMIQGLAWREEERGIWSHSGGDPGVSTYMGFRPRDGRGIVVVLNGSGRIRPEIAQRVFDR